MTAAEQPPDDRSGSESTVDHPTLQPIDGPGKVLIEITADVRARLGRWPVYDYVDRTFRAETGVETLAAIGQLHVTSYTIVLHPSSILRKASSDDPKWGATVL